MRSYIIKMTAYMTNIVFFLFWRFSSPRIQELASRSPSQTLEDGKKNYTCSTTHRALPTFRRSPPQQLKKNCGKNVISAVRFFSRLSSSNFLNLLRLQPGLFFYFRLRSFLLFIYPHSQSSFIRRQTAKIAAWNWDQKMFTLFRNSRTTMAC